MAQIYNDIRTIIHDSSPEDFDAKIKNPNSIENKMLATASALRHYLLSSHTIIKEALLLKTMVDEFIKSMKRPEHEQLSSSAEEFEDRNREPSSAQKLKTMLEKIDLALEKLNQMKVELTQQFDTEKGVLRQGTVTDISQKIQTNLGTNDSPEFNQALAESLVNHYETRERERSDMIDKIRQVRTSDPDIELEPVSPQDEKARFDLATQIQSINLLVGQITKSGLKINPDVRQATRTVNDADKMIKLLDKVITKLTENYESQVEQTNQAIIDLQLQRDSLLAASGLEPEHISHGRAAADQEEVISTSPPSHESPGATPTLNLGHVGVQKEYTRAQITDLFGVTDSVLRNMTDQQWERAIKTSMGIVNRTLEDSYSGYSSPRGRVKINTAEEAASLGAFLKTLENDASARNRLVVQAEPPHESLLEAGQRGTAARVAAEAQNAPTPAEAQPNAHVIANNNAPFDIEGGYRFKAFKNDFMSSLSPEEMAQCKMAGGTYKSLADLKSDTKVWELMEPDQQKYYEEQFAKDPKKEEKYPITIFLMRTANEDLQTKFSEKLDKASKMDILRESMVEKIVKKGESLQETKDQIGEKLGSMFKPGGPR